MKIRVMAVILILSICPALVSCQLYSDNPELEKMDLGSNSGIYKNNDDVMDRGPVKGGTLDLFSTIPDTLNPLLTKNTFVSDFLSFVYEGLVRLDEKQRPVPVLSDTWSVSSDGLIWNFHIRDGVLWNDGSALTAEDVEFTVESLLNARMDSVYKRLLQNVTTFAAVDSSNFKLVLRKPNSFTAEMMTFPILPGYLAEKVYAPGNFKPVGTGPYKFVSYTENRSVILERNEDWWYPDTLDDNKDDNKKEFMYIDQINIKLYNSPEDAINAFQTCDIDAACVNVDDFNKYDGRTDLVIKKYLSRDFEFLAFNLYNPVFADVSVRKAVAAAIDKEKILSDVLYGHGAVADLPINPDSWLLEEQSAEKETAGKQPRDILLEGGWKENEAGFYKTFAGVKKKLEIELQVNKENNRRIMIAEKICEQLNKSGIKSTVVVTPWKELFNLIDTKKFGVAYTGCRITQVPDISFLYSNTYLPLFYPVQEDAGRNISGYDNAEVNSYIDMIFKENDQDKKKKLFSDMKKIIDEDSPYIGLFFLNNAIIYRKSVRGSLEPYIWNRYNDITGWYLPALQ